MVGNVSVLAAPAGEYWLISDRDGGWASQVSTGAVGPLRTFPIPNAGEVSVSSAGSSVSLAPEDDAGQYPGAYDAPATQTLSFAPDATLTISAPGATVPGFALSLVVPTPATIVSPSPPTDGGKLRVEADAGVTITWANASCGDEVVVELVNSGVDTSLATRFAAPAAQGVLTVPREYLYVHGNQSIDISSYRMAVVDAGGWAIVGQVQVPATWVDGGAAIFGLDIE